MKLVLLVLRKFESYLSMDWLNLCEKSFYATNIMDELQQEY